MTQQSVNPMDSFINSGMSNDMAEDSLTIVQKPNGATIQVTQEFSEETAE
jgi:hypothetical protein